MGKKEEKRVLQSIFAQAAGVKSLFFILGFIFSTTWLAAIIYDFGKQTIGDNYTFIGIFIISIGILFYLFHYSDKLQKAFAFNDTIDINNEPEKPRKILIIFLSNIKDELYNSIPRDINTQSVSSWVNEGFNPWKMPYTAIDRHKSTLEKIYILTSSQSTRQFIQFKKIIRQSSKRKFDIKEMLVNDINDIDDYNSIMNTIYNENKVYKDEDIVIDTTSGTKLYSIAGSYFALSSEKIIQYVDTNSYKVYQFNNKILLDE